LIVNGVVFLVARKSDSC